MTVPQPPVLSSGDVEVGRRMDDLKPPRLLRASPLETGFLFGLGFFFAGAMGMGLAMFFGYALFTDVLR